MKVETHPRLEGSLVDLVSRLNLRRGDIRHTVPTHLGTREGGVHVEYTLIHVFTTETARRARTRNGTRNTWQIPGSKVLGAGLNPA